MNPRIDWSDSNSADWLVIWIKCRLPRLSGDCRIFHIAGNNILKRWVYRNFSLDAQNEEVRNLTHDIWKISGTFSAIDFFLCDAPIICFVFNKAACIVLTICINGFSVCVYCYSWIILLLFSFFYYLYQL